MISTLVVPLFGCAEHTKSVDQRAIVNSKDLWNLNPVDVSARFIQMLGSKKQLELAYPDLDIKSMKGNIMPDFTDIDKLVYNVNNEIEKIEFIGARPSKMQTSIENPYKIMTTEGKEIEFKNPVAIEVDFNVKFKKEKKKLKINEGLNKVTFVLVRDENGYYKIASAYK